MATTKQKQKLLKVLGKMGASDDVYNFSYAELKNEIENINNTVTEKETKNNTYLTDVNRKITLAQKAYESQMVSFRDKWDMNLNEIKENIKKVDGGIQSKALDIYNNKNRRFFTNSFQIANVYPNINFIPDPAATGITITSRDNPATQCTDLYFGFNLTIPTVRWSKETPDGLIDGSNTTYTITRTPLTNSVDLVVNGQVYTEGVDYSISGTTITMTIPLPVEFASLPFVAKYMY